MRRFWRDLVWTELELDPQVDATLKVRCDWKSMLVEEKEEMRMG